MNESFKSELMGHMNTAASVLKEARKLVILLEQDTEYMMPPHTSTDLIRLSTECYNALGEVDHMAHAFNHVAMQRPVPRVREKLV